MSQGLDFPLFVWMDFSFAKAGGRVAGLLRENDQVTIGVANSEFLAGVGRNFRPPHLHASNAHSG